MPAPPASARSAKTSRTSVTSTPSACAIPAADSGERAVGGARCEGGEGHGRIMVGRASIANRARAHARHRGRACDRRRPTKAVRSTSRPFDSAAEHADVARAGRARVSWSDDARAGR